MLSKYTYKDLTWLDLEDPTEEELSHALENKPANSLHFIVGNDTLITSRKFSTPEIKTFAKNFEMNLALERPIDMDSIDLLFLEIINFFRKHSENTNYKELLAQKNEELSRIKKEHSRKMLYLKIGITLMIIMIIYLLWH